MFVGCVSFCEVHVNGLISTGLTGINIVLPLASFCLVLLFFYFLINYVFVFVFVFCLCFFCLGCWLFAFLAFFVPVEIYNSLMSPVSCKNWRSSSVSSGCSSPSMLNSVNGMLCIVQYVFICVRSCSMVGH